MRWGSGAVCYIVLGIATVRLAIGDEPESGDPPVQVQQPQPGDPAMQPMFPKVPAFECPAGTAAQRSPSRDESWCENASGTREGPYRKVDVRHERQIVREIGQYAQGKKTGLWAKLDEHGRAERTLEFVDGKQTGVGRFWDADGKPQFYAEYREDKFEGRTIKWHKNGVKAEEEVYKNGVQDGVATEWYESGNLKKQVTYRAGKKHGPWTVWHDDGTSVTLSTEKEKGAFTNDAPSGVWVLRYDIHEGQGEIAGTGSLDSEAARKKWKCTSAERRPMKCGPGAAGDLDALRAISEYTDRRAAVLKGPFAAFAKKIEGPALAFCTAEDQMAHASEALDNCEKCDPLRPGPLHRKAERARAEVERTKRVFVGLSSTASQQLDSTVYPAFKEFVDKLITCNCPSMDGTRGPCRR